jgi:hypothetical protein
MVRRFHRLRCVAAVAVGAMHLAVALAEPFPATALPGTSLNSQIGNYEPSGLVWHTRLQRLFSVSDGSAAVPARVFSLTAAGTGLQVWEVAGDLEATAVANPATDFVYVGTEQPNQIKEFNVTSGLVTRTFDLDPWMSGAAGSGLEALAFVNDSSHPEGGRFYAGLQDGGVIYRFSLPIVSSTTSTAVSFLDSFTPVPGRSDLSGLDYDASAGVLYAVYDGPNYLRAMTTAGDLLREWDLPGSNQEGVAVRAGDLFIAEDSGDIVRYAPFTAVPEPGMLAGAGAVAAAGLAWRVRRGRQRTVARKW